MSTIPMTMSERFQSVIEVAVSLVGQFNEGQKALHFRTRQLSVQLQVLLEGLIPDDGKRVNVAKASLLAAQQGEYLVARWEMVQLIRQLRSAKVEWETPALEPASVLN